MPLESTTGLSADGINDLEPQRMNNWTLEITGLAGDAADTTSIILGLQAFQLPTETSDLIEVYYMNERRQYAGRTMYDGGTLSLTDWIDRGTANAIRKWRKEVYDPDTGRVGIKTQYAKQGDIYLYAPGGEAATPTTVKQWRLVNVWPVSVTWGQLEMGASEKVQIEVQLVYDKAIPQVVDGNWADQDVVGNIE